MTSNTRCRFLKSIIFVVIVLLANAINANANSFSHRHGFQIATFVAGLPAFFKVPFLSEAFMAHPPTISSRAASKTKPIWIESRLSRPRRTFAQSSMIESAATNTTTAEKLSFLSVDRKSNGDLRGAWPDAKRSLRNPNCCVVTVPGIDHHLHTLQSYFVGDSKNDIQDLIRSNEDGLVAPADLDLRMRVRCSSSDLRNGVTYSDCSKIYDAVMNPSSVEYESLFRKAKDENSAESITDLEREHGQNHPCILALQELALGIASLADGPLNPYSFEGIHDDDKIGDRAKITNNSKNVTDVHLRIVIASNYKAIDPMFHTDKCPLRGYVTLTGPGTEFMEKCCSPLQYIGLRSLGVDGLHLTSFGSGAKHLTMARELEFIVMKGDHYVAPLPNDTRSTWLDNLYEKIWARARACVHRSPPGVGGKRVIVSLDLSDGMDDQEWYQYNRKRGWRSGMTQRKSRLVA